MDKVYGLESGAAGQMNGVCWGGSCFVSQAHELFLASAQSSLPAPGLTQPLGAATNLFRLFLSLTSCINLVILGKIIKKMKKNVKSQHKKHSVERNIITVETSA